MYEGVIYCGLQWITPIICRAICAGKEHIIQIVNAKSDYTDRNNTALLYHKKGEFSTAGTFTQRIGNTVYRVNVHSSKTSNETMSDKIMRLAKNDISGKGANQ